MNASNSELAEQANRHLWGHFSSLGRSVDGMPIIERGEGCYVWDNHGNRYLDGLAGLYTTQVGYGRSELAAAAGAQAEVLGFFPIWTYAHPKAVELAARLAAGNAAYEKRFGRIFLIRAAGRTRAEILAELERRMTLDDAEELRVVARQLGENADLRLATMFPEEAA